MLVNFSFNLRPRRVESQIKRAEMIRGDNSISRNRFLISNIGNLKASPNGFLRNPFLIRSSSTREKLFLSFPSLRQSHDCQRSFSLNLCFASLRISFDRFKRRKKLRVRHFREFAQNSRVFTFYPVGRSYVIRRLVRST